MRSRDNCAHPADFSADGNIPKMCFRNHVETVDTKKARFCRKNSPFRDAGNSLLRLGASVPAKRNSRDWRICTG